MKQDEIIEMAKQAGMKAATAPSGTVGDYLWGTPHELAKFFRLAYARGMLKREEQLMQLFLDPENQPTQFGTATQEYREQEIKEEREACANLCEDQTQEYYSDGSKRAMNYQCADAIRARGEPTSRGEE